jgi:hypothetical protein
MQRLARVALHLTDVRERLEQLPGALVELVGALDGHHLVEHPRQHGRRVAVVGAGLDGAPEPEPVAQVHAELIGERSQGAET